MTDRDRIRAIGQYLAIMFLLFIIVYNVGQLRHVVDRIESRLPPVTTTTRGH